MAERASSANEVEVTRELKVSIEPSIAYVDRVKVNAVHLVLAGQPRRGSEQQPVDDTEHRSVGSDAESQREHDSGGERLTRSQAAKRISQILQSRLDSDHSTRVASLFLDAIHSTERDACLTRGLGM